MRFCSTVLLATLAITPVYAERIKASNSNERHIIPSNSPPEVSFEGEGGEGGGGNVIGLSRLLRRGSFEAQHSAAVGGDCALRFLPLALSLKPQRHKDCLRQREGQTTHYGLRMILRCAAFKTTLVEY